MLYCVVAQMSITCHKFVQAHQTQDILPFKHFFSKTNRHISSFALVLRKHLTYVLNQVNKVCVSIFIDI